MSEETKKELKKYVLARRKEFYNAIKRGKVTEYLSDRLAYDSKKMEILVSCGGPQVTIYVKEGFISGIWGFEVVNYQLNRQMVDDFKNARKWF